MQRVWESLSPARLGTGFRWLFAASTLTNLGDGVMLAAGPLLLASETRDPLLVAGGLFAQQLPWLLFGAFAGVLADRVDRRRLVVVADALRGLVVLSLAVTVGTGVVDVRLVLVTLFVLGTAETLSDVGGQTLLVGTVDRADLGVANARLMGAYIVSNELLGPPLGAFLFAVGRVVPFGATAACFALGAVLMSRMRRRPAPTREAGGSVRAEIAEGVRWLWRHPPVRTLFVTIVLFNVTFGAAWGVLVLWAQERLGVAEAGYGWLLTASALGGLAATAAYGRLERWAGLAGLMRIGLVIETLTHLALALTTSVPVALAVMAVFGAHAFVWGTTSTAVRQRAVPHALQGRVGSVYLMGVVGGMVVGTPLGGLLARTWGITAPFWFGFAGSALLVLALWREFGHIAHDVEGSSV